MTTDWVAVAHEQGYVWDLGQLEKADKRALDKATVAGDLVKERAYWHHMGPLRSCWISKPFTEKELKWFFDGWPR